MKIRVLGCHGGELRGHRTTCFLIDDKLAIDGGAITQALTLPEVLRVDDVFVTHSHFDHIKDIPMMTDLLVGRRETPVVLHGPSETMEVMHTDVFNDRVWPDFRKIPSKDKPVIALEPLRDFEAVSCQGWQIRAIPVHHPVYSVGYIIEGKGMSIAFSGDTGPTEELWRQVNATPNLKAVFLEVSFPNDLQWLADVSGHLTPRTAMGELGKLDRRGAKVYLYHLKPAVIDEIKAEIHALELDFVHICELDEIYDIG